MFAVLFGLSMDYEVCESPPGARLGIALVDRPVLLADS
jgi:hypothetical protein